MRPLDFVRSIKFKLGVVILAAVGMVVLVHSLGLRAEVPLVIVGGVSAVLALVVVQVLARGMTSPLREMVAASRAMAQGDYSRRVTATSRDEVGQLATAFNTMAAQLAETDRLRRDLIADVSHELRTPISALRAMLENVMDGVEEPDPAAMGTMLHQAERLARLVEQLLDLSRLESGAVPIERRAFALHELVDRVVGEAEINAAQWDGHPVSVSVEVTPPDLELQGDPERLHQVLANVLENAVRHSPPGGTVTVSARPEDGSVRLEVADEGPGIPETELARVFERFHRADGSGSSSDGGTGLGLSIARWIVELHGGRITAARNEPRGCRIVIAMPAS